MSFGPRETVTLLRDSTPDLDVYGDPTPGTETRIDVDDCLVAPTYSTEPTDRGRSGVVSGWTVYAPTGTDARHTDGIEIRAVVCRVDGEVGVWAGSPGGVVINAIRAAG